MVIQEVCSRVCVELRVYMKEHYLNACIVAVF